MSLNSTEAVFWHLFEDAFGLSILAFFFGKHTASYVREKEHFQRELVHEDSDLMNDLIPCWVHITTALFWVAKGWSLFRGSRSAGAYA